MNYIVTLLEKFDDLKIVARAEDGMEAVEALENRPADILITDIQMPKMNGIELAKRVSETYPDILTLIVSGLSDFEFAKEAIRAGVVEYLLKPFTPVQFIEVIAKMSVQIKNRRRSDRELWLRQAVAGTVGDRVFPGHIGLEPVLLGTLIVGASGQLPGDEFEYPDEVPMELAATYIHNKSELCFVSAKEVDISQLLRDLSFDAPFYTASYTTICPTEGAQVLYDMLRAVKRSAVPGCIKVFEYNSMPSIELAASDKERIILRNLRYEVSNVTKVKALLVDLFTVWEEEEKTIVLMEVTLTRLVQYMADNVPSGHSLPQERIAEIVPAICWQAENYLDILRKTWGVCAELYESLERMSDSGKLVDGIEKYIRENLGEPHSVYSICNVFKISNSQLYRAFRKHLKMTVVEYITELRIEEARRMLKDSTDDHIKDISAKLGFSDQFYFSKVFRSITGMSPSEYRNKYYMEL